MSAAHEGTAIISVRGLDTLVAVLRGVSLRLRLLVGAAAVATVLASRRSGGSARNLPGLPPLTRPVAIVELPIPELIVRLQQERDRATTPNVRCQRIALSILGLVRSVDPVLDVRLSSVLAAAMNYQGVRAFYVPGTDSIFTSDRAAPSVVHETVHALDDQLSPRMRLAEEAATTDERVALRSAIEGAAIVTLRTPPLRMELTDDLDENAWVFAYGVGPDYVRRLSQRDFRKALSLQPITTRTILFGPSPAPDTLETAPAAPGERTMCSDRLGVLGVLTAMHRAAVPRSEALWLASGWRADRVDVFAGAAGHRAVWRVGFADTAQMVRWRQATARWAATLDPAAVAILSEAVGETSRSSLLDRLGRAVGPVTLH